MSACKIVAIGRTGDGKSCVCRGLALRLGLSSEAIDEVFKDSSGISSHTHDPVFVTGGDPSVLVMDTPGLMDTHGAKRDEENITKIVKSVAKLKFVNGFCLVVNEEAPRFDSGMQDAVKLLYDSFGPDCFKNMGIVFTKAKGMVSATQSDEKRKEIADIISRKIGVSISWLPSWQVDLKPDDLRLLPFVRISDDQMKTLHEKKESTLDQIIRWARTKPDVNTENSIPGEYEELRRAREAEAKLQEAEERQKTAEAKQKTAEENKEKAEYIRKKFEDEKKEAEDKAKKAEDERKKAEDKAMNEELERKKAEKEKNEALDKARNEELEKMKAEIEKNVALAKAQNEEIERKKAEKEKNEALAKAQNEELEKMQAEKEKNDALTQMLNKELQRKQAEQEKHHALTKAQDEELQRIQAEQEKDDALAKMEEANKEKDKAIKKANENYEYRYISKSSKIPVIEKKEDDGIILGPVFGVTHQVHTADAVTTTTEEQKRKKVLQNDGTYIYTEWETIPNSTTTVTERKSK